MSTRKESVKRSEEVSRTSSESTSANFRNFRINKTNRLLVFNYSRSNSSTNKFQVTRTTTTTHTSIKNTAVILQKSNSKQKLQGRNGVVDTTFEKLQSSLLDLASQSSADTNRCVKKGMGCCMSMHINRGSMAKWGTVITHWCVRTENSKISFFDLQQTKIFESSSFSNRQHHCHTQFCENDRKRNQRLLNLSKEIWQYLLKHEITVTAKYLSSSLNVEADWQSQNSRGSSEWKLCPKVFQHVCQKRGMPKVDLLASKLIHQLAQYFAWKQDPFSQGADALKQICGNQFRYAFPSFSFILQALKKVSYHQTEKLLLVTPTSQSQIWYPFYQKCL